MWPSVLRATISLRHGSFLAVASLHYRLSALPSPAPARLALVAPHRVCPLPTHKPKLLPIAALVVSGAVSTVIARHKAIQKVSPSLSAPSASSLLKATPVQAGDTCLRSACRRLRASAVNALRFVSRRHFRAILALWSQTPFKPQPPLSVAKPHLTKPPSFSTRRGQCQQPRSRRKPHTSLLVPLVL